MAFRTVGTGFNVGCDICFKPRIALLLRRDPRRSTTPRDPAQKIQHFLRRFLSSGEQQLLWSKWGSPDAVLTGNKFDLFVSTIAGRWAAKEAMIKACTFRKLGPFDLLVLKDGSGAPYGVVLDEAPSGHPTSPAQSASKSNGAGSTPGTESMSLSEPTGKDSNGKDEDQSRATISHPDSKLVVRKVYPSGVSPVHHSDSSLVRKNGFRVSLSISHDGDYAMATCAMPLEPH